VVPKAWIADKAEWSVWNWQIRRSIDAWKAAKFRTGV